MIEFTDDQLEYIYYVGERFCQADPIGLTEELKTHLKEVFQARYEEACRNLGERLSHYYDEEFADTLNAKGIDTEKYKLLIIFLSDLTFSVFDSQLRFDKDDISQQIKLICSLLESNDNIVLSSGKQKTQIPHILAKVIHDYLSDKDFAWDSCSGLHLYSNTETDKIEPHRIKFFMKLLDYFIDCYDKTNNGRKDWKFVAQTLYRANFLSMKKLRGYEDSDPHGNLKPYAYIGKELKDMTKHCPDQEDISQSAYFYFFF